MFYFCTDGKKFKTIFAILGLSLLLVIGIVVRGSVMTRTAAISNATDYFQRVGFLEDLGAVIDPSVDEQKRDIYIPTQFSDVYQKYNALQKQAGYDLKNYRGKTVTQYTLKLQKFQGRDDVYAHLLVHDNRIIGGDIATTAINGFMLPLSAEAVRNAE